MQVDSFNKAMSARPSGSRLSRLFSGSKLSPPSSAGQASLGPQTLSLDDMLLSQPVRSAVVVRAAFRGTLPTGTLQRHPPLTLFLQDVIPTSLLKLGADNSLRAVKMFGGVQKYMGLGEASGEPPSDAMLVEVAARLMHQAIKRPELRDELYMQVECRLLAVQTVQRASDRMEGRRYLHMSQLGCQLMRVFALPIAAAEADARKFSKPADSTCMAALLPAGMPCATGPCFCGFGLRVCTLSGGDGGAGCPRRGPRLGCQDLGRAQALDQVRAAAPGAQHANMCSNDLTSTRVR